MQSGNVESKSLKAAEKNGIQHQDDSENSLILKLMEVSKLTYIKLINNENLLALNYLNMRRGEQKSY